MSKEIEADDGEMELGPFGLAYTQSVQGLKSDDWSVEAYGCDSGEPPTADGLFQAHLEDFLCPGSSSPPVSAVPLSVTICPTSIYHDVPEQKDSNFEHTLF